MLINVKMPTIVGILAFMSMINFVLSRVEHKKSFITSGPVRLAKAQPSRFSRHIYDTDADEGRDPNLGH